ncbi:Ephrin_rec_like domain-containing protein [Durusdinium trenchii]|uniref:Ephrin_rec_like domain-containing protein n=1 Tax=Durusdinium trenchii TaxID=1381693 RepID=A0ABP0I919_9DINO
MFCLTFLIVSLFHARQVIALCLANGTPEHARQYLQTDALENMSVGLLLGPWQSNFAVTKIAEILVTEVLGLHAKLHSEMMANSAGAIFAVGGCVDFNHADLGQKKCGLQETQIHVALDAWVGVAVSEQTAFQKMYPSLAPEDMGGMGYRGFETMYVTQSAFQEAYDSEGLALNFYLSYNTTHHDTKRYFTSISDLNVSDMISCADGTSFMNTEHMGNYYRWTGDIDGVTLQLDGTYIGKCSGPGVTGGWTSGSGTYIAKLTSPNLRQKSPRLRSFISKLSMDLNTVMDILQDVRTLPLSSLDAWQDPACSWITRHEHIWSKWIPVDTNCFLGFGVVDEHGTFLPSKTGSVAATEGSVACTPCGVGLYQDAFGKAACVTCADDTTTLLKGASDKEECVCKSGFIESNRQCVPCGEGLTCPSGSTVKLLLDGESSGGSGEDRPQISQSYFSWPEEPLEIYKCPGPHCAGGTPGTCVGGRLGPTCDECPSGMYGTSDGCQSCGIPMMAVWTGGICGVLVLVFGTYYFANPRYMLKVSLAECAKIGFDMTLAFMQNLGVLNAVSVPWPEGLRSLFQFSALFILNLRSLGFNCAAGGDVQQYTATVLLFLGIALSWPCLGSLSQLPCIKRRGMAWDFHKTLGVTGSFLQVVFTTLCNVGLVPFMCFSHPNGRSSIAKYPNIFCGGPDHLTMQILAALILSMGLTHFAACSWAIKKAPAWSTTSRHRLTSVHFLIANFKPGAWWFGLIILLRGPLISLPTVVATDLPGVNLALMICVWLSYLSIQLLYLPWKAPLLNLVDGISTMLFLVLLAVSLHLEPVLPESILILEIIGLGVYYLSIGVILCVCVLSIFLMVLKRCSRSGARTGPRIVNLGQLPDPEEILETIEQIYFNLKAKKNVTELVNKMSTSLSVDDLHIVQKALNILPTDCELGGGGSSRGRIAATRISQMSRKSFASLREEQRQKSSDEACEIQQESIASGSSDEVKQERDELKDPPSDDISI